MLTSKECNKIALNACISMFGLDFFNNHRPEFCCLKYEDKEAKQYEYSLLWAPLDDIKTNKRIIIGGDDSFDYYASVVVDMTDGTVHQDPNPGKTKLPK